LSVSCGCETWYVTLDEEHRSRGFENKVLWKVLGSRREEVAR